MVLMSVLSHCYNEVDNVEEVCARVKEVFEGLNDYVYEHVFIDNASTDGTQDKLRTLAARDRRVKVILNSRNFGVTRSGVYGILQCRGDAVIPVAADLQDPPELIPTFIKKWEEGYKVVLAVKRSAGESKLMYSIRRFYYRLVSRLSEIELIENYYGFGLYDRCIIEALRKMDDPYPYFRGLVMEAGFERALVHFDQPARKRGKSTYNFYRLYDVAMLGITSHSKVPLRLATMLGFAMSALSFLVGMGYLVYKLLFWKEFTLGLAPLLVAVFFLGSIQLFFTGILGEYIGFIYTHVRKRPLVIEKERINFEPPLNEPGSVKPRKQGEAEKAGDVAASDTDR
ncbi:MAG: glycosyltransferase family 2 protein [Acidobacteriota bacterium]